jgi:hypothetical protein
MISILEQLGQIGTLLIGIGMILISLYFIIDHFRDVMQKEYREAIKNHYRAKVDNLDRYMSEFPQVTDACQFLLNERDVGKFRSDMYEKYKR